MLSVITVNYNSSTLVRECLSSLVCALGGEHFEFTVVDSGSKAEDVQDLLSLEGGPVRIILKRENVGYARGINEGVKHTTGNIILITNPDVLYEAGSLRTMMRGLSELPRCGAVSPRTWWDRGKNFSLPPSELVRPRRILRTEAMKAFPRIGEVLLKRWMKMSLNYWLSEKPLRQEMLSGASIMTAREVFTKVGGFDEAFPLYFEDADWCLRVRKAGFYLYMIPSANMVHYYNQSAGQEMAPSREKFDCSSNIYLTKHFKAQRSLLGHILGLLPQGGDFVAWRYHNLGAFSTPPAFTFREDSEKLFLLSPVDVLIPSAGAIFKGNSFAIPDELWGHLGEERFFARAFELDGLAPRGAWCWVKRRSD